MRRSILLGEKMRNYKMIACLSLLWANSYAFDCYFTVAKNSCWLNYDAKVEVVDNALDKVIAVVDIPKGELWRRIHVKCEPKQSFRFIASSSSEMWKDQVGKKYNSRRRISLPIDIKSTEKAWNIPICFTNDFSGMPMPITAAHDCTCDWSKVPKVK